MSSHSAVQLRRACSLAAALAIVACGPDSAHGPLAPAAPVLSVASVAVPFRGTLQAAQTSLQPLGPTTALVQSEGAGTGTHLGRFVAVSALTLDFATLAGTSRWTLTAANGDVLTATTIGQGTPNGDGTLTVVESATITGGTGRFESATGSFILTCLVAQATGISSGSFEGTITLHK